MNIDQLVFFNKEGYAMNLNRDENFGYHYGKLYFDKNSTDTFKSLGIYLFEKTLPSNNTFQAYLDKFQAFNTDGFLTWPVSGAETFEITNIKKTNNSNQFFTKWIYGNGIEQTYRVGQWIYFSGLNSYLSTNFDTQISGNQQLFQILEVQPGRIMIKTAQNNSVALTSFTAGPTKTVTPVNVIEFDNNTTIPAWQESSAMTKIYTGKKLTLLAGMDSDGIWTSAGPSIAKTKSISTFSPIPPYVYSPATGDYIKFKLTFLTDRLLVSNGATIFAPITNPNAIQVPYIPYFLKIGDTIQAEAKNVPLSGGNTVTFTVTSIDKTNNQISVSPAPAAQSVNCYVYMATNILEINQDIVLDNNNLLSIPVTYWSLLKKWEAVLQGLDIELKYDTPTDSIIFKHLYAESYFTVTQEIYNVNNVIYNGPISPTVTNLNVYPYWITENLPAEEEALPDTSIYDRQFVFTSIDSEGLQFTINNIKYNVDFDTSVSNTTTDWISQHAAPLAALGIQATIATTTALNDTIRIVSDFPNRPIFIQTYMGDFTVWYVKYKEIQFANIKTQLLININGTDYVVPFTVSDAATVTSWFNTYNNQLETLGIYVSNTVSGTIDFRLRDPERSLIITYNIGYIPKSGDASVFETVYAPNSEGSTLTGNEIKVVSGTYDFLQFYATGQKININGALKLPQNGGFNIIGLSSDTLSLSYQGAFWQQGLPVFSLDIHSNFFIQQPKQGISTIDNRTILRWSWKDTQNDDIFLYDFSGDQLESIYTNFPAYNGVVPLCGTNAEIEIKLNKKPNDNIEWISDPLKQQTVFDVIENELLFTDSAINVQIEPNPIQIFIGYKSEIDSFTKSRLYCELIEDLSFNLTTATNFSDNVWVFSEIDNSLLVSSPLAPFNFMQLGFKIGQIIEITSVDVNADNRKLVSLLNHGKKFTIKQVLPNKLLFNETVISETSVKVIPKTTVPFYDPFGNPYTEQRRMQVALTVQPKMVAYFDIYGESEAEDERHRINLDNRNLNILKLQDFFIFKEVDIKEQGIDWIIMNRKRKQLLEIYPEIFNYVSSYKAIIQAINFFGYNDLTFTEYFQNIDPNSRKFGQLFNMEILNIFNKSIKGWSYNNLAIENLRNTGYRKTNLFSLNYMITDGDGNFVNGYTLEEVQIKLSGLKRWLTENLVPMGAKIVDINGKYTLPINWNIKHDTYKTKNFRVEEYSTPIDFTVDGYLQPINISSNQYNITVHPFSAGPIEWFDIVVRTFYLDTWISANIYTPGDFVYWNGYVWKATTNIGALQEPGLSTLWVQTDLDSIPSNQIIRDFRYNNQPLSFTINELVDPHFIVEVNWQSGYACALTNRKTYSVIPNFFDKLKI